ncbi:hypothetical protein DLD77_02005 [Chitinophaga alhagiae]|uniref:Uncharacterized protein n=2 Tax=Chitinophaga alhagiae TaxID=2203219 RepID=A0ABN5LMG5_9BACT|nr:hypothetical protein [Chitinophaga alhagiae]AWO00561.1 hypothetical protein DLD77_02005 [Chitinophaga alhagiae]
MGELAAVDLHDAHNEACGKCGMPVKGDCCKDEAKFLKLDDTHQAAKVFAGLTNTIIALPVSTQPLWLQPVHPAPVLHAWAPLHAPPLITAQPLYLHHCILLV